MQCSVSVISPCSSTPYLCSRMRKSAMCFWKASSGVLFRAMFSPLEQVGEGRSVSGSCPLGRGAFGAFSVRRSGFGDLRPVSCCRRFEDDANPSMQGVGDAAQGAERVAFVAWRLQPTDLLL